MSYQIALLPFYQQVVQPIAGVVLSSLATFIGVRVAQVITKHLKFLGQKTDTLLADGFNRALANGVQIALNSLHEYEGAHDSVSVKSWIAERAGQYAINHSADAVQRFTQLTPQGAAMKALAYINPGIEEAATEKLNQLSLDAAKPTA